MGSILAIIPARGGSKSIKGKNIVDIKGKPLISFSIETAEKLKELNKISKYIVSTDSIEIANISKELGAEVPFLRPGSISEDNSKSIEYIDHAINFFIEKNVFYDAILILQPTSPLRSLDVMVEAIDKFKDTDADSLISVYKEEYINELVMYTSKDKKILEPLSNNHNKGIRRQDHGSTYVRNGSIYLTKVSYIKQHRKIISDFPAMIEMSKLSSINIDTSEDLNLLLNIL